MFQLSSIMLAATNHTVRKVTYSDECESLSVNIRIQIKSNNKPSSFSPKKNFFYISPPNKRTRLTPINLLRYSTWIFNSRSKKLQIQKRPTNPSSQSCQIHKPYKCLNQVQTYLLSRRSIMAGVRSIPTPRPQPCCIQY